MKKVVWAGLALGFFAAMPVSAHIGDNLTQLKQVYGSTGKPVGNAIIFQRNGYSICVYFDGNLSAMEVFTRDGSDKKKKDISDADIRSILDMEGEGLGWSQVTSKSGKPTFLRADKKLIARLSPGDTPDQSVFMVMLNEK